MSLFSEREICADCRHAVWHSCGRCLAVCDANAEKLRNYVQGECPRYERRRPTRISAKALASPPGPEPTGPPRRRIRNVQPQRVRRSPPAPEKYSDEKLDELAKRIREA